MHHNALCITCIALVNCDRHLHMRYITRSQNLRSKRSKSKEYGSPQAISCEDTNIIVIKASPGVLTHAPCILLNLYFMFIYDCALSL
jgi:hypothetical protein